MIWVAWRQHRAALLALAGYALVVIAAFVVLRLQFTAALDALGLPDCLDELDTVRPCPVSEEHWALHSEFRNADEVARLAIFGFALLAGMFLGAPMFAREWEQRTHLLALSQSVSARRWFATRLAVVLGLAVLGAVVLSGAYWAVQASIGGSEGWQRLRPGFFEVRPVALIGYTLFALALGVAAGMLLRRTLAAMAVTLFGALGAVYVVKSFARPHYATPVVSVEPFDGTFPGFDADPGRWSLGQGFSDTNGRFVTANADAYRALEICEKEPGEYVDPAYQVCMAGQGFPGKAVNVHPGDRFWPFQFVEFGLFALVAGVLIALSAWWLRKRPI